ncbi:hypothetical protein GFB49_19320 [Epibacterium sp. SM1979]|uniref:Uncharacterized protein n=1 Tax=Tritonibacter litoralis TaxID=2662264 RepID=A0A843YMZ6_9RHOB|nr:hypothetical protein [Tritonibacter litoralis]MQQ10609.1 hypothetical protein [Tritonibacter litoralis]
MNDLGIELLTQPVSTKELIEATYMEAVVREGVFPSAAFKIAVPKLWQVETIGADVFPDPNTPAVPIARFTPGRTSAHGADMDAKVVVYSVFLPRVLNGSDWLRAFAPSQGLKLVGMRELPTAYGLMGDAVAYAPSTGRVHRLLTVKDGDLLFLIDGSVHAQGNPSAPGLQEIGLMAAMRFTLLSPSGQHYAEPMNALEIRAKSHSASFLVPASWDPVQPVDTPPDGAAVHLLHLQDEVSAGSLSAVLAGSGNTTAEELEAVFLAKLRRQGFQLSEAEPILHGSRGDINFNVVQYRGFLRDQERIVLSLRAHANAMPFSGQIVSASDEANFEQWAINRRVFEIMLETLDISML